ncbi:allantoin permease [Pseudomonas sp. BN417]|uniref:purine-cytosine permease family protein n=1 Tax=Pseudomonas sp. BN417 TaxID=2567890 RepID=UPI0024579E05|nr:allantoin permease [Pseudomonas sp. BN417]MDH4557927.1 allantoin permease [Pseudomonas sp. BN417]
MAGALSNKQSSPEQPVPDSQRLGRGSLTMAWWGICSAMFYLVVAAALAMGYGTLNAIVGLVLSVLSYGAINAAIARHAIASGLSVAQFSQVLFGRTGAALATLIFSATAIYYSVFEGSVMAVALHHYLPGFELHVAFLVVVAYSVLLIFGNAMRWLDKLNGVLLPFYLLGLVAAVAMAIGEYGYSSAWLAMAPESGPVPNGWWNCFTYFMGVWVLMMYTWDYARFGRQEDSRYHARFNFGMPFYVVAFLLNGLVGIFLAATIPTEGGLSEVSVVLAIVKLMGLAGLLFVWISQTRINTGNFFLAATNLQAFCTLLGLSQVPYAASALLTGALVYLLMLFDVFSYILQALAYQSLFIVGWVAIALAHLLGTRTDRYRLDKLPALRARGLLAWALSAAVGIGLHLSGDAALATASAPAAFITAFLGYLAAPLLLRRAQPQGDPG